MRARRSAARTIPVQIPSSPTAAGTPPTPRPGFRLPDWPAWPVGAVVVALVLASPGSSCLYKGR